MHVDYFIRQRPKRMDKSVSSFSEPAQGQACSRTDVKCLVTGTLPEHPTSIMLPGVPNQGKPSRRLHLPLTILHLLVSRVPCHKTTGTQHKETLRAHGNKGDLSKTTKTRFAPKEPPQSAERADGVP